MKKADLGTDYETVKNAIERFLTLPRHAGARKCEGIVNEKFAFQSLSYKDFEIGDFSLTSGDVSAPVQTSGVKNIVSTIFFTLPILSTGLTIRGEECTSQVC